MTQTQWHQTMVDNTFCAVSDFSRSRSNCSAVTFSCNRNNSEFCCCLVWRHFLTLPIQSKSQPENCLSREPEGHISTASNTTNTAKSLIFVCPLLHKLQYVNKIRKVKKRKYWHCICITFKPRPMPVNSSVTGCRNQKYWIFVLYTVPYRYK